MIAKKINKLRHIVSNTITEKKTLNQLKNHSIPTKKMSNAFIAAKHQNNDVKTIKIFKELNSYKQTLLSSNEIINYSIFNTQNRTVSEISKNASSRKRWCEFYYILSRALGAKNVLEIGTNLGVSGQYFLKAINENYGSQSLFDL